jgi:hypothetical protein
MAIRLRQRGAVLRETLPTPPVAGYARSSSFTYRNRIPAIPGGIRYRFFTP